MSMYKQFKTDADLEKKGVEIDYGDFRITIARAGRGNQKYAKILERKAKPFRRALQSGSLSDEKAISMLREAYAEAVILRWETLRDGEWEIGIEAPADGNKDKQFLPFTVENIILTLENLPDLFADIQSQSNDIALFRQEYLEDDAGN